MSAIIGFTGYAGSGKSTAAQILIRKHGFTLVKFAGSLKQMARCLGLGEREIEGDLKEVPHPLLCGKSPRQFMQLLGTEFGREMIGQDLWVRVAMAGAARALDQGGRVVIDDVRYPNEVAAIRDMGGRVLRISRPGVGPVNGHTSESPPPGDLDVFNTRDVGHLEEALWFAMSWLEIDEE